MKVIISSSPAYRTLLFTLLTIHTLQSCKCFVTNTYSLQPHSSHIHRNNKNNHHDFTTIYMSTSVEEDVSFVNEKSPSRIRRLSRRMGITRGEPKNNHNDEEVNENGRQMKFVGTKRVSTKPVAMSSSAGPTTIQLLNEFFMDDSKRNLLFPNNNAETLDITEISDELLRTWTTEAHLGGGEGPTTTHNFNTMVGTDNNSRSDTTKEAVFKIDALLQMPGLKIISQSTIGMKLLLSEHTYPEYQFTLLDSNIFPQEGSTPAPIIWLFHKLTQYRDTTSSFTRVRAVKEEKEESDARMISFITDARLETRMHLPQRLLNVLPNVNISKFESQGSDAVQKLLEKELEPALNGFCDAFCIFIEGKQKDIEVRKKDETKIEDATTALRP